MKTQKQFKRYIPTLIKNELDKLTYPRKDNLYVIIDLIYRKEIYYKSDHQKTYGYAEIALSQFKELLPSNNNLHEDLQFLIDHELIRRNEYYIIGVQSKSYKIPAEYMGQTVGVSIQNKNINKRILQQIAKRKRMKVKNLEFAKTEYHKTFSIDIDKANEAILNKTILEIKELGIKRKLKLSREEIIDIIECKNKNKHHRLLLVIHDRGAELDNILHRYMIHSSRINAINDGFLFFKRNSTNGRLDTNLTSLPSFLRPYIHSSEQLMTLDIKNSQPYFLYTLLKDRQGINPEELSQYADLVLGGTLYEFLIEKYKEHTNYDRTRKQVKVMLCKIFYSKNSSYQKYKEFFGRFFPTIMNFINTTNSVQNNTLSNLLTNLESNAVLDIIMPCLEKIGIIPYTIHDSLVCKESEAKIIEEVIITKMKELHGIAPKLHMDYIDEEEVIDEDEDSDEDWTDMCLESDSSNENDNGFWNWDTKEVA